MAALLTMTLLTIALPTIALLTVNLFTLKLLTIRLLTIATILTMERAYMQTGVPPSLVPVTWLSPPWQTDVPPSLLRALKSTPTFWCGLGVRGAEAQPMRLWVSAGGAVSPLHYDAAGSFLAQAYYNLPWPYTSHGSFLAEATILTMAIH